MLCRVSIVFGWFGLCMLIMSPETKCIDIAKSLTQLLDNFKDASCLPRDVHFGLNLAYKLLSGSALANPSGDSDRNEFYWKTLEYLKVLKSGSHTRNISVNDEIILQSISENSEVWQRSIKHRHLDIVKSKDTFLAYEWIVDKGLPTALDSDKCMSQLGSTKTCVISSKCVSMMISQQPAYGYHKTHQPGIQVHDTGRENPNHEVPLIEENVISEEIIVFNEKNIKIKTKIRQRNAASWKSNVKK